MSLNPFSEYAQGSADPQLDPDVQHILADWYIKTDIYYEKVHPDTFYAPFEKGHYDIIKLIQDPAIEFVVIVAPRGIGKTSLVRTFAAKCIHYLDKHFICYVSKSETHAMMQTENLKYSLLSSPMKNTYQPIKIKDEDGLPQEFSKKSWVASDYTIVVPRGSGQQVRGLNWRNWRPDLVILDDLEDDETIDNEEIRADRYEWFYSNVMECRNQIRDPRFRKQDFKLIYIDTVKHEDALIEHLMSDGKFNGIRISICDENYKTLFPIHAPQADLDKEIEEHRNRRPSTMDTFAREKMGVPVSLDNKAFRCVQYYNENDEVFQRRLKLGKVETVVIVDPAKTANPLNDQSGVVVWGFDVETNALYLREAVGYYILPEALYDIAFEKALHYKAIAMGWEITGLNEFIQQPVMNELSRRGLYIEMVWLKATGGRNAVSKIQRVKSLIPYYNQGMVYHNRANCAAVESQLITFPKCKLIDILDAAAYIVPMMAEGGILFQNKGTDSAEEQESDVEAEYEQLSYENEDPEYADILDPGIGGDMDNMLIGCSDEIYRSKEGTKYDKKRRYQHNR